MEKSKASQACRAWLWLLNCYWTIAIWGRGLVNSQLVDMIARTEQEDKIRVESPVHKRRITTPLLAVSSPDPGLPTFPLCLRTTAQRTASTRTPSLSLWRWPPSTTPSWPCPEPEGSPTTSRRSPWRTNELHRSWDGGSGGEGNGKEE